MKLNYCNSYDEDLQVEVLFHIYCALPPELEQASPYLPTLNHRFSYPFLSSSVAALWHLVTSDSLSFKSKDFCVFHSADQVQIMLLNHRLQFRVVCNAVQLRAATGQSCSPHPHLHTFAISFLSDLVICG